MRSNQRAIEINPAAYALQEIEQTLNSIEDQVSKINNCINIKATGVEPCSCCGLATCCCVLMSCVMCLPCAVGSEVLNILTCGHIDAQNQAKINAIQPDQNEMYAINQLKENLRSLPNQRNKLFVAQNSAASTISLIDNTLSSSAINILRPFLETLKANISSAHGLISPPNVIIEAIAVRI